MPTISSDGLLIVAAAALAAPLVLGLFPRIRLPAIVREIVLGIVIGPQVLGWVSIDTPIQVMSLSGLAFLLLLACLEVEYERFRGALLRVTALGYAASFGLALLIGLGLQASGLVKSPLLVGIALSATSLGIVIPVLEDAGQVDTPFWTTRRRRRLDRRHRDHRLAVALLLGGGKPEMNPPISQTPLPFIAHPPDGLVWPRKVNDRRRNCG
jgi:hypothetical protein